MITVVIPCHNSHLQKLNIPTGFFLHEHQYLGQIIVIFNGIDGDISDQIERLRAKIESVGVKFSYKIFQEQLNPGIARNQAYDLVTSKYVVFHDADDQPHPRKLEIIANAFRELGTDQLYHLFQPVELPFLDLKLDQIEYVEVKNDEYKDNNDLVLTKRTIGPVSHGLVAFRREKLLEWPATRTGEDRKLALECIKKGYKIYIIKTFLSSYNKYRLKKFKRSFPALYELFN